MFFIVDFEGGEVAIGVVGTSVFIVYSACLL